MSTFEALKLAYMRSAWGRDAHDREPGVLAVLAFGSISGSVGAVSVYPLNLVRTRLQASGSSGHPQRYTGMWDVAVRTYERDGWRGFYRGLFPTLAKVRIWHLGYAIMPCRVVENCSDVVFFTFAAQVVPAVSISYVVYEHSKRKWV
jgi:solute carrier family 25 phosphate transporter 23/24/25/41